VPDNRPGRWMYHCPILEHHAAGMMAHFEVVAPTIPRRSLKSTCTDAMHRTIYSSIIKLKTMETTKSKCTCSTICNCGDSCPGSNCTCGCNGCA
jgi:hypothetical protein